MKRIASRFKMVITLEEGILKGGFGSEVVEFFLDHNINHIELIRMGIPDEFVEQGDRKLLLEKYGLSTQGILETVRNSMYYNQRIKANVVSIHK